MEKLGARREHIGCAIGPCIARASYEVADDFAENFFRDDPANERFFAAGRAGHQQFDIEAYVAARLAAAGVTRIEAMGEDTYSQPSRFYSYRRSCHQGEPRSEEHTSELQSLMRITYAVFCLKKK